jgi:hypothetical protein
VLVLDWTIGTESSENREMVSYARAHGFLTESTEPPVSLVVTRSRLFLTPVSAVTLRKRFFSNICTPLGGGVLR